MLQQHLCLTVAAAIVVLKQSLLAHTLEPIMPIAASSSSCCWLVQTPVVQPQANNLELAKMDSHLQENPS